MSLYIRVKQDQISLAGALTIATLPLAESLKRLPIKTIDASQLITVDSAGALFLIELLEEQVHEKLIGLKASHQRLFSLIQQTRAEFQAVPLSAHLDPLWLRGLQAIGYHALFQAQELIALFSLIGQIFANLYEIIKKPRLFPFKAMLVTLETMGCGALPILGLLAFLIGIVLAYQLGVQLASYGANIFIAYLTGVAILREFGPLMAAIIIAGRSSSAFTAEIGTMKVNEEIDALRTMGLSPIRKLVLPKIFGMLVAFPLLIFWADLLGVLGSMTMAQISLGMNFHVFLDAFQANLPVSQLWVGLSKAPIFALIIALVGCHQGLQVQYNAESIGRYTTKSVVQAIFLIIIADAIFSIVYNFLGI